MENQKQNILIIESLTKSEIRKINKFLITEEGQKVDYIFIDCIYLKNAIKDNIKGLEVPIFCKKIFIDDSQTKYDNIEIFKNISKIPFDCKIKNINDFFYNEITEDYKIYSYKDDDLNINSSKTFKIINFYCLIDNFEENQYNIIQFKNNKIKFNNNKRSFFIPDGSKDYYNPISIIKDVYYYKIFVDDD